MTLTEHQTNPNGRSICTLVAHSFESRKVEKAEKRVRCCRRARRHG